MHCVPLWHFFAEDEKAIPVYEPSEIPEDPNKIKDTDCEVVKLVKELLDTYPCFHFLGFLIPIEFVRACSKMAATFSSSSGFPRRARSSFA